MRGIGALENGTYTHCPELQTIFTKYKDESDFAVHFGLYVTNNIAISTNIQNALNDFNISKENYDAKGYSLDEIEGLYYGEPIKEGKNLSYDISNSNKIHTNLDSSEKIEKIVRLYKAALSAYHTGWVNQNLGKDYNDMIKSQFDKKLMDTSRTMALSITN